MKKRTATTKYISAVLALLMLASALSSCASVFPTSNECERLNNASPSEHLYSAINPDSEVRGVWIASVLNINYPSSPDLSAKQLKSELDDIIATVKGASLNTIYFQVRPSSDALYKSDIFPVSKYISSTGKLPFDPLEYLVREAHKNNIFVHAWVNPLRITASMSDDRQSALDSLPESSPAKLNESAAVFYADGKLYFDPGLPEVKDLVTDGITEIVKNYDVDGVVIDDYFYPYPVYHQGTTQLAEFDDASTFEKYGAGFTDIADWRRENINAIVKSIYGAVKSADPECRFGVSPFGIWQNNDGTNGGSATVGLEAYSSIYCDARAWIDGGYIDYIAPQIAWRFSDKSSSYSTLVRWWNSVVDGTDVRLIISHVPYKYDDGLWTDPSGEMQSQVEFARSQSAYIGSIFYGYESIKNNSQSVADELRNVFSRSIVYSGTEPSGLPLNVVSPPSGTIIDGESTYIFGSSDPTVPLYFAWQPIGRTRSGYFSLYVPLNRGRNDLVFTYGGKEITHTLFSYYNPDAATPPTTQQPPKILDTFSVVDPYPSADMLVDGGYRLTIGATAPVGAAVYAAVGGYTVKLTASGSAENASETGYAAVRYTGTLELPCCADDEIITVGTLTITAVMGEHAASVKGAQIRIRGKDAYVELLVKSNDTEVKLSQTSLYYDDYTPQSAGMTDYAVFAADGWYKYRFGGYVRASDVTENGYVANPPLSVIETVSVADRGKTTDIIVETDRNVPYNCYISDGEFILTLYDIDGTPPNADIGKNPLFSSFKIVSGARVGVYKYYFRLTDPLNYYGFDLTYTENGAILSLRNPKSLDLSSDKPLSGTVIVLDAGHGGYDNGALGYDKNEKDINLAIVLAAAGRLRNAGADVILTRSDDTYISLDERAAILREASPDLSVSVHQNSMPYTADITSIRGTVSLWWADAGRMLAESLSETIPDALSRQNRGTEKMMLAMCKNQKFPSSLVEVGFITSAEEYETMVSGDGIEKTADALLESILLYFEKQATFADQQGW